MTTYEDAQLLVKEAYLLKRQAEILHAALKFYFIKAKEDFTALQPQRRAIDQYYEHAIDIIHEAGFDISFVAGRQPEVVASTGSGMRCERIV